MHAYTDISAISEYQPINQPDQFISGALLRSDWLGVWRCESKQGFSLKLFSFFTVTSIIFHVNKRMQQKTVFLVRSRLWQQIAHPAFECGHLEQV